MNEYKILVERENLHSIIKFYDSNGTKKVSSVI